MPFNIIFNDLYIYTYIFQRFYNDMLMNLYSTFNYREIYASIIIIPE